jgi:sec-independent protein translocase protein TatC
MHPLETSHSPAPVSDGEEETMLQMSILEHLDELRQRIIYALAGIGVAYFLSLLFSRALWHAISQPAVATLLALGLPPADAKLTVITPGEAFSIVWIKLPFIASLFLAAPWVAYQAWAFVAPGLYRKERRWAAPLLLSAAGLFLLGGAFAYFMAFRYGLTFLLSLALDIDARPLVSVSEYFDLFVDIILGVSVAFELPLLIFLLTALRLVTPGFLFRHSRYAILTITILAAVLTPTTDAMNMLIFVVPMCALYFAGVLAGYLFSSRHHGRKPPRRVLVAGGAVLLLAGGGWFYAWRRGYRPARNWPFFARP